MWKGVPSHFPFLLTFIKNAFLFLVEIMKKNDQSWREKSSDDPLISYQKRKKTRKDIGGELRRRNRATGKERILEPEKCFNSTQIYG